MLFLLLALGCGRAEPPRRQEPKAAPESVDSIPAGPLSGKIGGAPFSLGNARYVIDSRPGHEQLAILLTSSALQEPCGDLDRSHASTVWLRRAGSERPRAGVSRIDPKADGDWRAHYDLFRDGRWSGNGDSAALLSLHEVAVDLRLTGELSVCFGDVEGSCVAGTFSAHYCPIGVDQPVRGASALEPLPGEGATHP